VNFRLNGDEAGPKAGRRLPFAWAVVVFGGLIRLLGDLSASFGEKLAGTLLVLVGSVVVLSLRLMPRIGDSRPPTGPIKPCARRSTGIALPLHSLTRSL
jgi:hypothetical protein